MERQEYCAGCYEFYNIARSNAKAEKATWPFGAPIKYDGKKQKNLPRLEIQRSRIHAIAQASRGGAVFEDMAEVGAAIGAVHLGAGAPEAFVHFGAHSAGSLRIEKRGPAGAAVVFGFGVKQRLVATNAGVDAVSLVVGVFAGEGALGGFVARNVKGQRLSAFFAQLFAPLVISFLDFVVRHGGLSRRTRNLNRRGPVGRESCVRFHAGLLGEGLLQQTLQSGQLGEIFHAGGADGLLA